MLKELYAKDVKCIPPRQEVKAPAGAPSVVSIDLGTPVVEAIGAEAKSRFTGRITKETVEVK